MLAFGGTQRTAPGKAVEVDHESLHQHQMRGLRPHRLFSGNPLSTMQVGPEIHTSRQRSGRFAQAGAGCFRGALRARSTRGSSSNIFIPQVWTRADEFRHQLNTFGIIQHREMHAPLPKKIFGAKKVSVLSDDDAGDAVEQGRARTHDARAEGADQRQFVPVAPAARMANANRLGMRGRIATLYAQVVTAGQDLTVAVGQY
jgi:hypothetical protein